MNTSAILTSEMINNTTESQETQNSAVTQMNNGEIYTRVASNVELIGLYLQINQKILNEPGARPSRLFMRLTSNLAEIKQTLDQIELKLSFQHPWFPKDKFVSFWAFYNKVNVIHE